MSIYPSLSGNTVKKLKKLLSIIAASVPFTPDLKKIKTLLDIGDERTLKTYLKYLEDAGVILTVSKNGQGLRSLGKPEKIYLNNPNLIQALVGSSQTNRGTIRETFFLNMVQNLYEVCLPARGDFRVGEKYTFEVGGRKKTYDQIRDLPDSYLAVDELEVGIGNRIPISKIVNERGAITPDMALRLSRAFDTTPDFWLNLQTNYDLWQAETASKDWQKVKPFPHHILHLP